jgi:uncharacterized membrane protein
MKNILSYLFGLLLLASAIGHVIYQEFYAEMIPDFIPAGFANIVTAIVEAAVAVLLFLPRYRHWGGLGFLLIDDRLLTHSRLGCIQRASRRGAISGT